MLLVNNAISISSGSEPVGLPSALLLEAPVTAAATAFTQSLEDRYRESGATRNRNHTSVTQLTVIPGRRARRAQPNTETPTP